MEGRVATQALDSTVVAAFEEFVFCDVKGEVLHAQLSVLTASRKPHTGLQHIARSSRFPVGGILRAPVERKPQRRDFRLRHRNFRLLQKKAIYSVRLPNSWNKLKGT